MGVVMACSSGTSVPQQKEDGIIRGTGVITYMDLEGGFYGLVADDGERYDAVSLAESFQEDGLPVRFAVRIRTGVMSIRMWGQPVEVVELERLDN